MNKTISPSLALPSSFMKSGLQKEVLALYKNFLQIANQQSVPSVRDNLKQFLRREFKCKANEIHPKDINGIEHQMRMARKRLEFFKGHKSIKSFKF